MADNVQSLDKVSSIVFDLKDSLDPDARRVDALIFVCRQQWSCVLCEKSDKARVTAAGFSYFRNEYGDKIYRGMYGAKIIFNNRKKLCVPETFAKSEPSSRKDS